MHSPMSMFLNWTLRTQLICLCVPLVLLGGCGGGGSDTGGGGAGGANGTIVLAWDANTQPNLAGYRLYYGTAPNGYSNAVDVGAVQPGGTVTHTLDGLTPGETYYVAVTAYDAANIQSDYSNEVSAVAQ